MLKSTRRDALKGQPQCLWSRGF